MLLAARFTRLWNLYLRLYWTFSWKFLLSSLQKKSFTKKSSDWTSIYYYNTINDGEEWSLSSYELRVPTICKVGDRRWNSSVSLSWHPAVVSKTPVPSSPTTLLDLRYQPPLLATCIQIDEDCKYLRAHLAFNQKVFFIRHYRNPNRSNPNRAKYSACKNN